jgi:hypothetical protein
MLRAARKTSSEGSWHSIMPIEVLMFVVLYLPDHADPEIFGPFTTIQPAINAMRRISTAAGHAMQLSHSDLMATINVIISGERHRYQLLKIGSPVQLDAHAYVIEGEREAHHITVEDREEVPPPARLSSY